MGWIEEKDREEEKDQRDKRDPRVAGKGETMRQIRITRNYNGSLGRFFRGVCVLQKEETAAQLVQDGYAEYVDEVVALPHPPAPSPAGEGEAELAVEPQAENMMRPKGKARG